MATQVQFRRGTTAQNASFTGALGEVTVDTDKDTLVVHDGGTAGGFEISRADASNLKFPDGAVGTPAISFASDTNTGIYRGGTDILKFVTAGTDAITIDASQNVDINGTVTADGLTVSTDSYRQLLLTFPDSFTSKLQLGFSTFYLQGSATTDELTIANNTSGQTKFINQSKTSMLIDNSGDISFYEDTGTTPKLFWDASAESLGIGTTTPNTTNLNSGTTSGIVVKSGGVAKNNFVALPSTGGSQWDVRESGSGGEFTMRMFDTSGTHNVQISSNGNHFFNGGNVGIGTSSPSTLLMVEPSARTTNFSASDYTTYADILVKNPTNDSTCATGIAFITDATTYTNGASGIAAISGSGDTESSLAFITRPNGAVAAERMRITSAGNVGIGTSSPDRELDLVKSSDSCIMSITSGTSNISGVVLGDTADDDRGGILYNNSGDYLYFLSNASERMRILQDGSNRTRVYIDADDPAQNSYFTVSGNNNNHVMITTNDTSTTGGAAVRFKVNTAFVGQITCSASSTSYTSASDHRLKENVTADWDATTRLKQLNPVRFNFIADADTTVDGFLAHEVQSVVPEAITGTHNEVDADGNPVYQGIDQSKLVPLLVKTIQELEARITALENGV